MKKVISVILSLVLALSALSAFSLCSFAESGVEVITKVGDVDGDGEIKIVDAKWILQSVAKKKTLTDTQEIAADTNQDGKTSIADAKRVLQHIAGVKDIFSNDGWVDV